VLQEELVAAVALTPEEVAGGWTALFPGLARALPEPYPIFAADDETVVTLGYPVHAGELLATVRSRLERMVDEEVAYRVALRAGGRADKRELSELRAAWRAILVPAFENALVSDAGRRLPEVLALAVAAECLEALGRVPALVVHRDPHATRGDAETIRFACARSLAEQLLRAVQEAGDRLRRLSAEPRGSPRPLIRALAADGLALALRRLEPELGFLPAYVEAHHRRDATSFVRTLAAVRGRLETLLARERALRAALVLLAGGEPPAAILALTPALWRLLERMGAADEVADPSTRELLTTLGLALKRSELVMALRRRVARVATPGPTPVLADRRPPVALAPTIRPFDFARPGVVDSAVRRFGLIYDLVSFTTELEEVRKAGRAAEERALRFMFAFQNGLADIAGRYRLQFEKHLGDGAFYSARRALRVVGAACEILLRYDELRERGFPFARGIRMAANFATYHLVPMPSPGADGVRYEFFGHGIVELARLTTGKAEREIEEMAEFLVHAGYDPDRVDRFLAPLLDRRGTGGEASPRRYAVRIDDAGHLLNQGIVVTAPFLEELERELGGRAPLAVSAWGLRWLAWPLDPDRAGGPWFGLRYLGVPRLKGLPPLELAELTVWAAPPEGEEHEAGDLLRNLRVLAMGRPSGPEERPVAVPEDLVVVSYLAGGQRTWVFGLYRHEDDMLIHALELPIQTPDLQPGEPLEMWLFRNRFELCRLYEGMRRELSGASVPLAALRQRDGYVGCFLAAPHRAPA